MKPGSPGLGMRAVRKSKTHATFSQVPDRSGQQPLSPAQPRASLAAPSTSSSRSLTAGVPGAQTSGPCSQGLLSGLPASTQIITGPVFPKLTPVAAPSPWGLKSCPAKSCNQPLEGLKGISNSKQPSQNLAHPLAPASSWGLRAEARLSRPLPSCRQTAYCPHTLRINPASPSPDAQWSKPPATSTGTTLPPHQRAPHSSRCGLLEAKVKSYPPCASNHSGGARDRIVCPLPPQFICGGHRLTVTVFGDEAFKEGLTLSEVAG